MGDLSWSAAPQGQPGVEQGDALQAPPMALRTLLEVGAREPLHQGAGRLQGPRRWRWVLERPTAGSQRLGTTPIAEHPVVAQALEASREDMQQKRRMNSATGRTITLTVLPCR